MHVVAVNGFKRAGKGECARILSDLYGGVTYEIGFADKLKILAAGVLGVAENPRDDIALMDDFKLFGVLQSWMRDPDGDSNRVQITGREFLQNLGNEARRVLGDTVWIDMVLPNPRDFTGADWDRELRETAEAMYPDVDLLIITDLRYPNEAQRVKDVGGVIWEVVRPEVESDGHASEQVLARELVDYTITNYGDLEDLETSVRMAVEATLC